jgi:hypothetical protein
MAPEQIRELPADHRYRHLRDWARSSNDLLTGKRAFDGASRMPSAWR